MNKLNWIKMGNLLIKMIIISVIVIVFIKSSENVYIYKTENFSFNKVLGMSAMAVKNEEEKVVVKSSSSSSKLSGTLTGYAADCPKCGGTLACKSSYKVYKNNVVTYPDSEYGEVRIVASSKSMPCGSIVKFNLSSVSSEPIIAIVLDRGVLGNSLDLLMSTEDEANVKVGRKSITYEVLRRGW